MEKHRKQILGAAFAVVYVAAIVLANWLAQHIGFVRVWPSHWQAVAGVYAAGLTFPTRDFVQRALGWQWGVALIVIAAVLSWAISPTFAIASGVTFLVSEGLDFLVYTPMQRRWFRSGVVASSSVSAVVDSWLFLTLAHIPLSVAFAGMVTGKLEVVWLCGLPLAVTLRRSKALAVTA